MRKTNDLRAASRRRKRMSLLRRSILLLALLIMAVLFIMPTLTTFVNSFLSEGEINESYGPALGTGGEEYSSEKTTLKLIPDWVSGEQYEMFLFQSPDYLYKFWNSVLYVVPITLFQTAVAALAAYGFSRYKGKIRSAVFFGYVVLMLMPYQVTLVPNYIVTKWMGIFDTPWAIVLPGIFSPFAVYILTRYMMRIPTEYTEAAQLDGAGEWKIFTKIYLPQCKSSLYAVVLLIFFDYWNMVEQPLVLLETEEQFPLSIYISTINANEVGLAFAAAVVYMIPCLLLFMHGEEHLESGIVTGGMK
ncbi:MAG: carbohydrate ABC transporter permease [Clostridia bacterium]|nr:carbohydrate ABC transporter permease [Clostridia bacterium]